MLPLKGLSFCHNKVSRLTKSCSLFPQYEPLTGASSIAFFAHWKSRTLVGDVAAVKCEADALPGVL